MFYDLSASTTVLVGADTVLSAEGVWSMAYRRKGPAWMLALSVVAIWLSVGSAEAINLVLSFDAGSSATPTFDPDGSQLTAILEEAAAYWEDIIEDTQTINVTFYYDSLSDNTLADHLTISTSGNVETSMRLRFDVTDIGGNNSNWFFDPTPSDHSERLHAAAHHGHPAGAGYFLDAEVL